MCDFELDVSNEMHSHRTLCLEQSRNAENLRLKLGGMFIVKIGNFYEQRCKLSWSSARFTLYLSSPVQIRQNVTQQFENCCNTLGF